MHTIKDIFLLVIDKDDSKVGRLQARPQSEIPPAYRKQASAGAASELSNIPTGFRLTPEEIKTADARSQLVNCPSADFTPGPIFTKGTGLKSHDWKKVNLHL